MQSTVSIKSCYVTVLNLDVVVAEWFFIRRIGEAKLKAQCRKCCNKLVTFKFKLTVDE